MRPSAHVPREDAPGCVRDGLVVREAWGCVVLLAEPPETGETVGP